MYNRIADQILKAFSAYADKDTIRKQPIYIIRSMFMEELQVKLGVNAEKAMSILRDIEINVTADALDSIGIPKMRLLVDSIVAILKAHNEAHLEDFGVECYSIPGMSLKFN